MRQINEAGLSLIWGFEKLFLTTYLDPIGLPTIGYGHLIRAGEDFSRGITEQEAGELLKYDLNKVYRSILRLVRVPLTDNQYAALCSFIFNLGGGALQRSTLLRKINRGESPKGEWEKWRYAGGKPSKGLLRRRQAEAALYNL